MTLFKAFTLVPGDDERYDKLVCERCHDHLGVEAVAIGNVDSDGGLHYAHHLSCFNALTVERGPSVHARPARPVPRPSIRSRRTGYLRQSAGRLGRGKPEPRRQLGRRG
jgi:hypothetical protein